MEYLIGVGLAVIVCVFVMSAGFDRAASSMLLIAAS
jgi:hypothetical protein